MPQVSGNFSAYPVKVTLDGSGNGAVVFQAVGANLRISNLSVRVSSQTAQAVATVYKNQIGTDYRLSGTNSGSSGDNLSIPVDLFDGERVLVVWTGGDPGAEATATFSGKQLPFDQVGKGEGGANWTSPIAAGDGSLIYPSIKSPNFVTGVAGWYIGRDGIVEFASGTFRGEVNIVGANRTVRADTNGVSVTPIPVDGASVLLTTGPAFGGALRFTPINATSPGVAMTTANWYVGRNDNGAGDVRPYARIESSAVAGIPNKAQGSVVAYGQNANSALNDSYVDINASRVIANGSEPFKRWVTGASKATAQTPAANTENILLTIPSFTYRANHAYEVVVAMEFSVSAAPNGPIFRIRRDNGTTPIPTGTEIRQTRKPAIATAMHNGDFVCKFTVGAADVTTGLVLSGTSASAGFTFTQLASPICYVDVYDMGDAGNNPNVVQL